MNFGKKKPSREELEKAKEGRSTKGLSEYYGVSVNSIRRWLHEYNLELPGGERGPGGSQKKDINMDFVIKMANSGVSQADIAGMLGVSNYVVNRRLQEIGYKKPEIKVENPKGVNCMADPRICMKCVYGSGDVCMYIMFGKGRRPCPAYDCTVFEESKKKIDPYHGNVRWYD